MSQFDRDDGVSRRKVLECTAMLNRLRSQAPRIFCTAERDTMAGDANAEQDRARRFRDAALPHLDDVFALARYLMRNAADAEDASAICGRCAILTAIAVRP